MFQGQSGGSLDMARQLARTIANDGATEPNVDPVDRLAVEELVRVAEVQVDAALEVPVARGEALRVEVHNRTQWADRTIVDYTPLFEQLSSSMAGGIGTATDDLPESDPMATMMAQLGQMLGPMMLGMTTGSMVGHLARRSLGGYDLPVPRASDAPVIVLARNVDAFGDEWSLDRDDLRLWVCLHEIAHHAVLGVPHVRDRLNDLLLRHAAAFENDPSRLEDRLGGIDLAAGPEALAELQERLGDPEAILGAVRSPAQEAIQPELTALVAAITGFVDHTMDRIGATLIGSYPMITEALRRRRVEADQSDRFVERILGLELDRAQYDRGAAFAAGVVERAGEDGLARLLDDPTHLPTATEVDAPGLWLARIDLPD